MLCFGPLGGAVELVPDHVCLFTYYNVSNIRYRLKEVRPYVLVMYYYFYEFGNKDKDKINCSQLLVVLDLFKLAH